MAYEEKLTIYSGLT